MQLRKTLLNSLILILILILILSSLVLAKASQPNYYVYHINEDGSFSDVILTTTIFNDANNKMKEISAETPNVVVISDQSKSPLQIVATDRGYVQSYPYRKSTLGSTTAAALTLSIYSNKGLTSKLTYTGAHYKMFYHESEIVGNNIVAKISFEGTTGYVDIDKVDIIPFIFVEKGFAITIGGNEDYYEKNTGTPEAKYSMRIKPDYYLVDYDSNTKTNRIYHVTTKSWYNSEASVLSNGIAPVWLEVGMYYSLDGVQFYYDIDLKNPVHNGENIGEYYSYFQWLPLRTVAEYTGEEYHSYLGSIGKTNSILYGTVESGEYKAEPFKTEGEIDKNRMNSLLFFAQAALESAYGTSYYAVNRFNLFGWNAYDSQPNNASYYDGIKDVVGTHMSKNMMYYVDQSDYRFGTSFGNKGFGISVQYASDPYYGKKVASIAASIDARLGSKEYNKYILAKLDDYTAINIRKDPSTSNTPLYTTKSAYKNQIVALESNDKYGDDENFYKILIPASNTQTTATYGYVHQDLLEILTPNMIGEIEVSQVKDGETTETFILEALLNFRTAPSTSNSSVLYQIPSGTILTGSLTNNGWVKTTYKGKTGYISYEYALIYNETSISQPPSNAPVNPPDPVDPPDPTDPPEPTDPPKVLGDINGDGEIDIVDFAMLRSHMLKITTLNNEQYIAADFNNDEEVDIVDFAMLRSHMLGIKKLGE